MKIPGTTKSKFENIFRLAKIVLCIVHSNAEEESLFSRVKKNLTPQRASLSLDATLSSIMCFQLNRPQNETCYQYVPSQNVLRRSREVTWEYNKEHMSKK
jgi:hemerythrin superfamily protein